MHQEDIVTHTCTKFDYVRLAQTYSYTYSLPWPDFYFNCEAWTIYYS